MTHMKNYQLIKLLEKQNPNDIALLYDRFEDKAFAIESVENGTFLSEEGDTSGKIGIRELTPQLAKCGYSKEDVGTHLCTVLYAD